MTHSARWILTGIALTANILLSPGVAFAQKIRFSDTSNQWSYLLTTCCDPPNTIPVATPEPTIYFIGTVTDSGILYDSLLYLGLVREDTVTGKVFIRYSNPCAISAASVETLLYDYHWNVGDTVRPPTFCGNNPVCWVVGIDSTMINSIWYKIWHFEGSYHGTIIDLNYFVIEDLGCTNGLFYPVNPYPQFERSEQLICFSYRGINYPLSSVVPSWGLLGDIYFDNVSSCDIPLKNNNTVQQNKCAVIYPNPINESSKIVPSNPISSGRLIIVNDIGQTVTVQQLQNIKEIPIGSTVIVSGIYYYRVTNNETGQVFTGKFVK